MELVERLLHFPSMLRSIEESVLVKNLLLYPYFGVLYLLQALKRQFKALDQEEEYFPPVLANDGIYSWYRMGVMHSCNQAVDPHDRESEVIGGRISDESHVEDSNESKEEQSEQYVAKRSNGSLIGMVTEVVEVSALDDMEEDTDAGSPEPEDKSRLSHDVETRIIYREKYSLPRITVNSIYEKGGRVSFAGTGDYEYFDPNSEELSGFARFLRKSTRNTSINPEMRSESTPDPSDAKQSHSVAAMSPHLISVKSGEEVEEKSEKKKKKKRKKELVDRLVQQSISDNELLVSEPFAEILYAQGYKDKAIKIYEKLMLKNPEKRDIFAAKIVLINNEKN